MIDRLRQVAYISLGCMAITLGTVMFGIALYQFIQYPALSSRIGAMVLFGCVVYVGVRGLQEGRRIRVKRAKV